MEDTITVFIEDNGDITFLDSPLTWAFDFGPDVKRRYSSVEPDNAVLRGAFIVLRALSNETGSVSDWTRRWPCLWRAHIKGGPILEIRSHDRQQVINAEIAYFNSNGVQQ